MNNSIARFNLVLTISLVVVGILCAQYFFKTKELRQLQATAAYYQQRDLILKQLVAELLEYSKTNPAIDPLLVSINAKPGKSPTLPTPTKK